MYLFFRLRKNQRTSKGREKWEYVFDTHQLPIHLICIQNVTFWISIRFSFNTKFVISITKSKFMIGNSTCHFFTSEKTETRVLMSFHEDEVWMLLSLPKPVKNYGKSRIVLHGWFSCFRTFVVVSIFPEFISSSATALLNITSFSCLYIDVLEIRNVFPGSLYWTWLIDSSKAKTECIENGMAALIFFNFKQKTFPKKFCQQL